MGKGNHSLEYQDTILINQNIVIQQKNKKRIYIL